MAITMLRQRLHDLQTWSKQGKVMSPKVVKFGLLICLLLSLALRLFSWQVEPTLSRDGISYIEKAEILQKSNDDSEKNVIVSSGLYSEYIASRLFYMTPAQLGIWTNIVLGTLLPVLFFAIAFILFKKNELALAIAFLAAVHPKLIEYSIVVQREMPYLFCCGLFFLFLLFFYNSGKWFWSIPIGVTATLGMFMRIEGIELLLIAFAIFALYSIKCRKKRVRSLVASGVFVIIVILSSMYCLEVVGQSFEKHMEMMFNKAVDYSIWMVNR